MTNFSQCRKFNESAIWPVCASEVHLSKSKLEHTAPGIELYFLQPSILQHLGLSRTRLILLLLVVFLVGHVSGAPRHWLKLKSNHLTIGIDRDLALSVYYDSEPQPAWNSMAPTAAIKTAGDQEKNILQKLKFEDATKRSADPYRSNMLQGYRIRLGGWENTDVTLAFDMTLDSKRRLNVQVSQGAGNDQVLEILNLYTFTLAPDRSAYAIVPRGSGYMIRADSSSPVNLTGFVGAEYSLPLFGLVKGDYTAYPIIETWWDASLRVDHEPGRLSRIALDWKASLGHLRYPRRVIWTFDRGKDHVAIAKAYRKHLEDSRALPTLQDRRLSNPRLEQFLSGIEYRLLSWDDQPHEQVLENIRHFQASGLPITFFHPKWPSQDRTPAGWQEYLRKVPVVEGGWPAARKLEEQVHALGCAVKFFVMPHVYHENAPYFDPSKLSGVDFPRFSDGHTLEALKHMLDHVDETGLRIDALYFDGHAAHRGHSEHKSAKGLVSRRETYSAQVETFREARRRGIIPGAELARFWCMGESDYFFFTDWSSDRLWEGDPIPLFQLVFNDCYVAHFSGGGYYSAGKYDWFADRHPRLYELMYGAMPSHNWLPGGETPIEETHWGSEAMKRRLKWLRLWHTYFQAISDIEMTNHSFLRDDRTLQRVTYANGVVAEFDLTQGRFRVRGIEGISQNWQFPEIVEPVNP